MCNHYNIRSHGDKFGIFDFTCVDCYANVEPVLNKHDLHEWRQYRLCEYCNDKYYGEPVPYPDPDSKHCKSEYCSPECADEAVDQVRCNETMDRYEYEMWGNDLDSWYR